MLNKIIQYSLHNRLLVMIAAVALLIWGSITAHNMEVDVFPDLNAPTVVVMTEAQGMAPEEVERLVTFPVETATEPPTSDVYVRLLPQVSRSYGLNSNGVRIFIQPGRLYRKSWQPWEKHFLIMSVLPPWAPNLRSWVK